MRSASLFLVLPLLAGVAPDARVGGEAPSPVDIREWEVPYAESRPRDPYVGPDGGVYFVGQRTHYVARLDPESGEFRKWDLEPGTGPHNLIVDADGIVWYAGNRAGHIGRLDPATGEITKYPMPGCGEGNPESVSSLESCKARDPHTLVFDGRGGIWFTVQQGNLVGKFDPTSGTVQLIEIPTERARPYGIMPDGSGRPWIALLGTNKIATVDPETMELEEVVLPRDGARPRRIDVDSDGAVWYVDYAEGYLGRYHPASGEIREWSNPSGSGARPYAMAADDKDRIWFVETGPSPNRFVGFDPESEEFFGITEVPSGGGTLRHMVFHARTRTIWFGADTNTVGRIVVP